jgi:hypothetical protein
MISDLCTLFFILIAGDEDGVANFCWTGATSDSLNGLKFVEFSLMIAC